MHSYKIGNKVTAIIRAYSAGNIGSVSMEYKNQPYTIIKDVEASLNFSDINTNVKSSFNQLAYNNRKLNDFTISDVELTNKILNLIFLKSEEKLFTATDNCVSEDNKIYINAPTEKIYQVFVYDNEQHLESAFGVLEDSVVEVEKNNSPYLVIYQYEGTTSYNFDKPNNQYYTVDLITKGNKDEETTNSTIHIEKCNLAVDRNMSFNSSMDYVNLRFTVLDSGNNYITLE